MFSGIVQEIGEILSLKHSDGILELTIKSNIKGIELGDSISVDGCCQTVSSRNQVVDGGQSFTIQATEETLNKTNFKTYKIGDKVNLEPALKMGDKISGHLVSGHVDACGEIYNIIQNGENTVVQVQYSRDLRKFITNKGSICVNGVSLTVIDSDLENRCIFSFTLIPFTRSNTNLGLIKKGNLVNLEIDLISRYLINYLETNKLNDLALKS